MKKLLLFLLLSLPASPASVNLTWTDNSNNETSFKVERSPAGASPVFVQIGSVGANITTYDDLNLPNSTSYVYRVRASNAVGDSPYSNTTSVTTLPPPPTAPIAPTNLTAVAGP